MPKLKVTVIEGVCEATMDGDPVVFRGECEISLRATNMVAKLGVRGKHMMVNSGKYSGDISIPLEEGELEATISEIQKERILESFAE